MICSSTALGSATSIFAMNYFCELATDVRRTHEHGHRDLDLARSRVGLLGRTTPDRRRVEQTNFGLTGFLVGSWWSM